MTTKQFVHGSCLVLVMLFLFFFFNDTATTEIYTLSLHDALPISPIPASAWSDTACPVADPGSSAGGRSRPAAVRSEEHTSELQSQSNLVCRLLLEKKKHALLLTATRIMRAQVTANEQLNTSYAAF